MSENPCPCNLAAWPSATMNTNVLELPMYSAASNRKQEFTLRRSPRPGRRWNLQTSSSPSPTDRKSTRLNSSHLVISYAVFCLKKKKQITNVTMYQVLMMVVRPRVEQPDRC